MLKFLHAKISALKVKTFYELGHRCTYSTVSDLFGVSISSACQIFHQSNTKQQLSCMVILLKCQEVILIGKKSWNSSCRITSFFVSEFGMGSTFTLVLSVNLITVLKKRYLVSNMGLKGVYLSVFPKTLTKVVSKSSCGGVPLYHQN